MPIIAEVEEGGEVKSLHQMDMYLPAGSTGTLRGKVPTMPLKLLTPDNRPSIGEQLRTCGNCVHFQPRSLEEIMKEGVGTFLRKEAHLIADPTKGHHEPPPGYELFRAAEAGFCRQRDSKFLAQVHGTCRDGWRPNHQKLAPWLRQYGAGALLEYEEHRQKGLKAKADADLAREKAEAAKRPRGWDSWFSKLFGG